MKRIAVLALMLGWMGTGCRSPGANPASAAAPGTKPAAPVATQITHVDAAGAARLIAAKQVLVVDVRTPAEFAAGHIAGAREINFSAPNFAQQLARVDRNQVCLVHCAGGGRSTQALATFQQLGFKSVVHLDGGFRSWQKAGLPVEH